MCGSGTALLYRLQHSIGGQAEHREKVETNQNLTIYVSSINEFKLLKTFCLIFKSLAFGPEDVAHRKFFIFSIEKAV